MERGGKDRRCLYQEYPGMVLDPEIITDDAWSLAQFEDNGNV